MRLIEWKDIRLSVLATKVGDDKSRSRLLPLADSIEDGLKMIESLAEGEKRSPLIDKLEQKEFIEHQGDLYFSSKRKVYKVKTLWKPFVKGKSYTTIPNTKAGKQLLNVLVYNHFASTQTLHERFEEFEGLGGIVKTEAVLYEYFTPTPIVEALSELLSCLNLPNKNFLEPSAGSGNLVSIAKKLELNTTAVELNPVLGGMLNLRYPQSNVLSGKDFLTSSFDKRFGLIVANPPYGKHTSGAKKEQMFLNKCYQLLEEGGVMAFILPAFSNLQTQGEILLGFRLPSNVFSATSISTDLVIMRKKGEGISNNIDAYFADKPEHVLGNVQGSGRFKKVVSKAKTKALAKTILRLGEKSFCKGGLSDEPTTSLQGGDIGFVQEEQNKAYYSLVESYKLYNNGITLEEISAYCFVHPNAIENQIISNLITDVDTLVGSGALIWDVSTGYHYVYEYLSENVQRKYATFLSSSNEIIAKFGEEGFAAMKAAFFAVLPEPKTFKSGQANSLRHLAPHADIFRETIITGLKTQEYPRPLTALAGFTGYVRKNAGSWLGADDILQYYVFGANVPNRRIPNSKNLTYDALLLEKKRIKESASVRGRELLDEFIHLLKPDELSLLDKKFNEKFFGFTQLKTDKIPVTIPFQVRSLGGKAFELNNAQRAGIAQMRSQGSTIIHFGVGLGKTYTLIAEAARALHSGDSELVLIFVPDQTYEQWERSIADFTDSIDVYPIRELNVNRIFKMKSFSSSELKRIKDIKETLKETRALLKEHKDRKVSGELKGDLFLYTGKASEDVWGNADESFLASLSSVKDLLLERYQETFDGMMAIAKANNIFHKVTDAKSRVAGANLLAKGILTILNKTLTHIIYNNGSFSLGKRPIILGNYSALRRLTIPVTSKSLDSIAFILSQDSDGDTTREDAKTMEDLKAFVSSDGLMDIHSLIGNKKKVTLCIDEMHNMRNLVTKVTASPLSEKERYDMLSAGVYQKYEVKSPYKLQGGASSQAKKALCLVAHLALKGGRTIGLTATPWNKSPLEIYSLLSLLNPLGIESEIGSVKNFFDYFLKEGYDLGVDTQGRLKLKHEIKGFYSLDVLYSLLDRYVLSKEAVLQRPCRVILPLKTDKLPSDAEHCSTIPVGSNRLNSFPIESKVSPTTGIATVFAAIRSWASEVYDKDAAMARSLKAINMMDKAAISPYLFYLDDAYSSRANKLYIPDVILAVLEAQGYWKMPTLKELLEESPKIRYVVESLKRLKAHHDAKGEPMSGSIIYLDKGIILFDMIRNLIIKELELEPTEVGIISGGYYPYDLKENTLGKLKSFKQGYKPKIQEEFNKGLKKVIIASSSVKEGISLQKRTFSLFILTIDWNPTGYEQLMGRAWRQGNHHKYILIPFVLMEDSMDVFRNNKLKVKLNIIKQLHAGKDTEIGEFSPSEALIELVKDPKKKVELLTYFRINEVKGKKEVAETTVQALTKYLELKESLGEKEKTLIEVATKANAYLAENKKINLSLKGSRLLTSLIARLQNDVTLERELGTSIQTIGSYKNVLKYLNENILKLEVQVAKIVPSLKVAEIKKTIQDFGKEIQTFEGSLKKILEEKTTLERKFAEKVSIDIDTIKSAKELANLFYLSDYKFGKPSPTPNKKNSKAKARAKILILKLKYKYKAA